MDVNTGDGIINKFISLDYNVDDSSIVSVYQNYGAIYYDKRDYRDYQPYFYTAFVKDDEMFMLRVQDNSINPQIDWNHRFIEFTAAEVALEPLLNTK